MWQDYIKKLVLILLLIPISVYAADKKENFFTEGQDYVKLPESVRTNKIVEQLVNANPNKIDVIFFFNYGCHGCEYFHQPFLAWITKQRQNDKSKTIIYEYPVAFNAQWKMLAQLYYVRKILDPDGKLDDVIFKAVHKQGLKLWDINVMRKFFIEHGFTGVQFDAAYNSFAVNRQVQKADNIAKAYSVSATPDIIVNGPVNSYKIDVARAGKNSQKILDILNYLVAREAKLL